MKTPIKTDRRQAIKTVAPDTADYEGEELVHSRNYWWDELSDTFVIDEDEAVVNYMVTMYNDAHPADYYDAIDMLENEGFKLVFYLYNVLYKA